MNLRKSRRAVVMLGVIACLLLALSGTTGISRAAGAIWYVDATAAGLNDGTSWADAFTDLQSALAAAGSDDEIWVGAGTHKPTDGTDRYATFQLVNGVALYGGFEGTETSRDQRDWTLYETILSGNIGAPGDDSDNSYHVVTGSGTDATAVLDGFTITGGNADGSLPYDHGGGMYNDGGSPTLTNVIFSGNSAEQGGGMYNDDYSSPTLTNVTFTGNSAEQGGGMSNRNHSNPTLTNVTFSGNSADEGGGMLNAGYSSPTLTNVTFSGNSADYRGGGMWNYDNSNPTLTNVTFSGNSAEISGGGMYNSNSSNPTVASTILWGNIAPDGPQIYNDGSSSATVSYGDCQGGCPGTGNIDADPRFVDPDGPDDTVGTVDDNLRLQLTSPAIDAGDNSAVPSGITFDLDGEPRFLDVPTVPDTGLGTPPIVDMGAYETQPPPPPPAPAAPTPPVPEWGSMGLLGSGLAGVAGYAGLRMRRKLRP